MEISYRSDKSSAVTLAAYSPSECPHTQLGCTPRLFKLAVSASSSATIEHWEYTAILELCIAHFSAGGLGGYIYDTSVGDNSNSSEHLLRRKLS